MFYQKKYLKYKDKYCKLKNMIGGAAAVQGNVLAKHNTEADRKPIIWDDKQVAIRMFRINTPDVRTKSDVELIPMLNIYEDKASYANGDEAVSVHFYCNQCNGFDGYPRYNFRDYDVDFCEGCVNEFKITPIDAPLKGFPEGFNKYPDYKGEKI